MRGVRTGGGMGVRGGVEVGERRGRRALVHSPRGEAARSRGAGRGGRAPRRARRRSPRGRRRGSRRRRRRPCRLREDGRCGVGGGAGRVRVGARSRGAIDRRREKKRRSFRLSRRDVPLEICARAVVSTALTATERLGATLAPRTDALAPSARGAVIAEAMLGVRARGGVRVRERVCGNDGGPRNVVQEQCQRGIREHPQRLDGNRRCRVERGGFGRDCAPVRFGGIFFLPGQSVLTECRCEQKRTPAGQPARRGRGRKSHPRRRSRSTVFRSLSYPQILARLRRSGAQALRRSGAQALRRSGAQTSGRFAFSGGDGPSVGRHHAR